MEVISLCLKEIFSSFREHFSSPIPPHLVTTESFILFMFSVVQLPSPSVTLMEESTMNPMTGRTKLPHHESPGTACEKALSFQPWRGYQIAFNVASINAGPQDVCLLQVSWELKNLFAGNDIIPLKSYLKENICELAGKLLSVAF